MFTSVANWARKPPVAFPVLPWPGAGERSSTTTSRQPRAARCQATLAPITPPPAMTTSGIFGQPDAAELEPGLRSPEVPVARPDVVRRGGAGAAPQHADVVHELPVVLHQGP